MRFHGMVGDHVPISPSATHWRPPEYITVATTSKTGVRGRHSHGSKDNSISDQSDFYSTSTRSSRNTPAKLYSSPFRPISVPRSLKQLLPLPCTNRRYFRRAIQFKLIQKFLAILVAIMVALSLLCSITTIFRNKLDILEWQLENAYIHHDLPYDTRFPAFDSDSHHSRKLASVASRGDDKSEFDTVQIGFWSQVKQISSSFERILQIISNRHAHGLTFSALQSIVTSGITRHLRSHEIIANKSETRFKGATAGAYQNISDAVPTVYLLNTSQLSAVHPISKPHDTPNVTSSRPGIITGGNQPASSIRTTIFPFHEHSYNSEKLSRTNDSDTTFRMHAHHVAVPNYEKDSGSNLKNWGVIEEAEPPISHDETHLRTIDILEAQGHFVQRHHDLSSEGAGHHPDALEIHEIPGGQSLCRIYNAARLPDGTLVLPQWMAAHSISLLRKCGITDVIFAMKRRDDQDGVGYILDGPKLKGTLKSDIHVDIANMDRDLFGNMTPRDHMPHFVTDILSTLVASERAFGSDKEMLNSSVIYATKGFEQSMPSALMFRELKPLLLMSERTMNRSSSDWVSKLSQFFTHPNVGFEIVKAENEEFGSIYSSSKAIAVTVVRSVVIGNTNPFSTYGLFDSGGNNVVFSLNGVTRKPVWTLDNVSQNPCRISVTALNRKGSRELLNLGDLEHRIRELATTASLEVDFREVDFSDVPFEDQVNTAQNTNVLIGAHGAGNSNIIFMRPSAAFIEVFPFAYKAGPFDGLARAFGLEYTPTMSAPQTTVFKECMMKFEQDPSVRENIFHRWDQAVAAETIHPWVHRLRLEKELHIPGSLYDGGATRRCVRFQKLQFNINAVAIRAVEAGKRQCMAAI